MAKLTRPQANALLLDGVQADLRDGQEVAVLLERQFEAAVRHRTAELSELAGQLTPLLDAMEARRQQRVSLVRALLGQDAGMDAFFASLEPGARAAGEAAWRALETLILACKAATTRNASLLAEQYSVMQRVLHGEDDIYAPR
ncbi:flagellar protein FlgN [Massilia sp. KIM]|uniref:flagellar export chaperone FlgN n=1 Tax=Massilia sp. KIM TaxID=1955422 RepID=UPI00099013CB|nr:flagellar export chaperone FlgN [Massilia sp. KIM]OON64111.1 flagellar protein FlgN [Massilia sp. KIM]